ncbi:MAG: Actin- protein 6 [Vezdaea aestivalis]|nr:MAG: Actin- protein 6 [Vezdaea aestivalis]
MPRFSKTASRTLGSKTLVVDNGAYTIKAGFALPQDQDEPRSECQILTNAIVRDRTRHTWVGAQFDKCRDFRELLFRRPMEKGYIVNWEVQREIWEDTFFSNHARLKCDPQETNLIVSEAPNAPQALQTNCDQIVFEEYEFLAYYRSLGSTLNSFVDVSSFSGSPTPIARAPPKPAGCVLVIDCGYSHSTVNPVVNGRVIQSAVRRLDIGGKFLTNFLKENISLRSYNMMDETYIINEMKEKVSFVSDNFSEDLERAWKGGRGDARPAVLSHEWNPETNRSDIVAESGRRNTVIDYVLPNLDKQQTGFLRQHDALQALKLKKSLASGSEDFDAFITLGNERFAGPELLFNPSDIGMRQLGLPDLIMSSLKSVPFGLHPALLANVVLTGGTANLEGLDSRLETELRPLVPDSYQVRVRKPAK